MSWVQPTSKEELSSNKESTEMEASEHDEIEQLEEAEQRERSIKKATKEYKKVKQELVTQMQEDQRESSAQEVKEKLATQMQADKKSDAQEVKVELDDKRPLKPEMTPFAYAIELLLLSHVMLWTLFVGVMLRFAGWTSAEARKVNVPKLKPTETKKRKPPDKKYRTKKLWRLAVTAALNVMAQTPKLLTGSDRKVMCDLQHHHKRKKGRKKGHLNLKKVPLQMLPKVRSLLEAVSGSKMGEEMEMFDVIVDTGCTTSSSPFKEDFLPGTLKDLEDPISAEGVGGDIQVKQEGTLKWEFISTKGEAVKLHHEGCFVPELGKTRLLSPQHCLQDMNDEEGNFCVKARSCSHHAKDGQEILAQLQMETGLPVMTGFRAFCSSDKFLL